jgi:hypothetical protein
VRINVKLFGLLPQYVSGYDCSKGIVVEALEGITYGDLVGLLRLPAADVGLFSVAGIIKKPEDPILDGEEVNIFMILGGG